MRLDEPWVHFPNEFDDLPNDLDSFPKEFDKLGEGLVFGFS